MLIAILPLLVVTAETSVGDQKVGSAIPALNYNSAAACPLGHSILCVDLRLLSPEDILLKATFVYNYLAVRVHTCPFTLQSSIARSIKHCLIAAAERSQGCLMPTSALQLGCALAKRV